MLVSITIHPKIRSRNLLARKFRWRAGQGHATFLKAVDSRRYAHGLPNVLLNDNHRNALPDNLGECFVYLRALSRTVDVVCVGMTRAKNRLILSSAMDEGSESRFLEEAGLV